MLRCGADCEKQNHEKRDDVADHELRETKPHLAEARAVAVALFDARGPNVCEHEGPDADEDIDEDLHRRRRAEDPALRVVDAAGGRVGENQ